ncbi:MAG: NAD(P)/FAD-dependent oxidoreductase [Thermoplasmatales archaeon]|nr:MAG: NAD(P)/FAD-dependent oxidoreductase [Thermoplasmatales archaeon]
MKKFDMAVVGGGPVGGYVAKRMASLGFKTALFEEHKNIGAPLNCAGLVSSRVFELADVSKSKVVQNEVFGAHIYSPSGEMLTIGGDKAHALVIDRSRFDKALVNGAEKKGVELYLGSKVTSGKKRKNILELEALQKENTNQICCSLVIGADGSRSTVRSIFGFPQPTEFLRGIGAEVTNINLNPKFVEIFLDRNIAPGFFAWVIPINKEGSEARIGLCIDARLGHTLKRCFTALLKTKRLQYVKIIRYLGGTIPLGALRKTVRSNIMLVGDAAAQVKPTSGGGVYPGLLCARCCVSVAAEALERNDCTAQYLSKYHMLWSKEIGRELLLGMRYRRFFKNLTNGQLDRIVKTLNNEKTIDVINEHGDIDYPSKLAYPLLKMSPSLIKFLPSVFKIRKK